MPIFGHLLVLVASYCFLVALEALSIYKIDYSRIGLKPIGLNERQASRVLETPYFFWL